MFSKKKNDEPTPESQQTTVGEHIARETMTGDLRDLILDFLKNDKNPLTWNLRGEQEQMDVIARVELAVNYAAERAVKLIAADGRKTITARLDKVVIKDDIQALLVLSKDNPDRHYVFDSQGTPVLIVVADADEFTGERAPVAINPKQASLPMEEPDEDGAGMEDPQP